MSIQDNRRENRVTLKSPLKVVMGSLGTEIRYNLVTKDISTSGFFLAFEKPGRFPFTSESIIEVWLELDDRTSIFFNGKMARIVLPSDDDATRTGPGIAVRIVQIERNDDKLLKDFIRAAVQEMSDTQQQEAAS